MYLDSKLEIDVFCYLQGLNSREDDWGQLFSIRESKIHRQFALRSHWNRDFESLARSEIIWYQKLR